MSTSRAFRVGPFQLTRPDGSMEMYADLYTAKAAARSTGGAIRPVEVRAPDPADEVQHFCIGCERIVRGRWMDWLHGEWRCLQCRDPNSKCPDVDHEPSRTWG